MRTYELAIVADPRLSDEDFVGLMDETKTLISSRGGELVREESWGKRKLAYPIRKLTEGQYSFLYLQMPAENASLFAEVELRLQQNDKVLRYLTVRTDLDMKRATNRAKPGQPVKTIHSDSMESGRDSAESGRDSRVAVKNERDAVESTLDSGGAAPEAAESTPDPTVAAPESSVDSSEAAPESTLDSSEAAPESTLDSSEAAPESAASALDSGKEA